MSHNQSIENFNQKQNEIDDAYKNLYPEYLLLDGVLNVEKYLHTTPKILWILKEAYTTEKAWKEARNDRNEISEDWASQIPTYRNMELVSREILKGVNPHFNPENVYADTMNSIAIINLKKIPKISEDGSDVYSSEMDIVESEFNRSKDLLKSQIDLMSPDIIIGGGTFYIFKNLFNIEWNTPECKGLLDRTYVEKDGKLIIDGYHPSFYGKGSVELRHAIIAKGIEFGKSLLENNTL